MEKNSCLRTLQVQVHTPFFFDASNYKRTLWEKMQLNLITLIGKNRFTKGAFFILSALDNC